MKCLKLKQACYSCYSCFPPPPPPCLPVTDNTFLVIFHSLSLSDLGHRMFWAAYKLAYFGFLLSFRNSCCSGLKRVFYLPALLHPHWPREVYLCVLTRGSKAGPLFLFKDGTPFSRARLTDWLWRILSAAGLQQLFSSQGLRTNHLLLFHLFFLHCSVQIWL